MQPPTATSICCAQWLHTQQTPPCNHVQCRADAQSWMITRWSLGHRSSIYTKLIGAARPPGTSRLRTGMAPSGPGTEAAQGASINATINVSDRPLTGQGVMGMKHKAQGDRMVFDASHYVGQIRRRITDLNNETSKLRGETEQITKDNSQYSQYEKKYEALIKSKDSLEGQLADYNLAMDKSRTSTDPDEVLQLAHHLADKNRHGSQELDRVFMVRKQREGEVQGLEEQLEAHYRAIQARINELEPGKLRAYNDLMAKQREYQEKTQQSEHKLNELSARLRQLEADDKGSSLRKEYVLLEKTVQNKKRDLQTAQEELDIVNLEPKEAHARYVARVNEFKQVGLFCLALPHLTSYIFTLDTKCCVVCRLLSITHVRTIVDTALIVLL